MVSLFAFLHHLAAFVLVAALAVEFVLIEGDLTAEKARKLLVADLVFGVGAGAVLVVGLLRVFLFEKGAAYYFHSVPFIAKVSLFAVVGLLSIYPTVTFLSWRATLKQGLVPAVALAKIAFYFAASCIGSWPRSLQSCCARHSWRVASATSVPESLVWGNPRALQHREIRCPSIRN